MATPSPTELPATKNPATIYSTDVQSSAGPTDTPEVQHYPERTEEGEQGTSFVTLFLAISAFILVVLVVWRLLIVMAVL
jgi:hypothetical protein